MVSKVRQYPALKKVGYRDNQFGYNKIVLKENV